MQTQRRIAHQSDVDLSGCGVDLILVEAIGSIILGQPCTEAERLAQSHVLQEPVRSTGPGARQAITGHRQHTAHNIIFRIPISQPTAEKQCKDCFDVVGIKL